MKKFLLSLTVLFFSITSNEDSVILMLGDVMGEKHLECANKEKPLYLLTLPTKGAIITRSANAEVTDSAASATAYACGQKTNNKYIGKLANGENCLTLAEEAVQEDIAVGIYSTDFSTGATPSAFYAHVSSRDNNDEIEKHKKLASKKMDIAVPVTKLSEIIDNKLEKLSKNKNGFFVLFEGAKIDVYSHKNLFQEMKNELYDFDKAVIKATDFVQKNPQITLIVLADHETGGLTNSCEFTTNKHTGVNVPLYAYGKHANLFKGEKDNTDIHKTIHQILFQN